MLARHAVTGRQIPHGTSDSMMSDMNTSEFTSIEQYMTILCTGSYLRCLLSYYHAREGKERIYTVTHMSQTNQNIQHLIHWDKSADHIAHNQRVNKMHTLQK